MKRYAIIKKSVPTEETLTLCPIAKTHYHIYGKNQKTIQFIWNKDSYDFNDPELKSLVRSMGWEAPKGCKISLRAHQKYAEHETQRGCFVSTCEMVEVEI